MMKKLLVLLVVLGITSAAGAVDVVDIVISSWGAAGQGTDPFQIVTDPIDPTHEITLLPSEWVNLDIIYTDDGTGAGLISLGLDILVTGPATLYVGELGPAGLNTLLTFPVGAWDLGQVPAPISFIGPAIGGGMIIDLAMAAGLMGQAGVPVIALDHILLHCEDIGEVTVTVINDAVGTTGGGTFNFMAAVPAFGPGVVITQIPEPMTIALLGLGGLFLLRRRR